MVSIPDLLAYCSKQQPTLVVMASNLMDARSGQA